MAICYLGIGSNVGNRRKNIVRAFKKINSLENTKIIRTSRLLATNPAGGPANQGKFLNAAAKIITSLQPLSLLKQLKKIESEIGRKKSIVNGPRVIDLDILFYDERIIKSNVLIVPHPRLFFRKFVLMPLSEII